MTLRPLLPNHIESLDLQAQGAAGFRDMFAPESLTTTRSTGSSELAAVVEATATGRRVGVIAAYGIDEVARVTMYTLASAAADRTSRLVLLEGAACFLMWSIEALGLDGAAFEVLGEPEGAIAAFLSGYCERIVYIPSYDLGAGGLDRSVYHLTNTGARRIRDRVAGYTVHP